MQIIGRVGGKSRLCKQLVKKFPDDIKIYCEPFVGGGSVFFEMDKHDVEIINDLDTDISDIYKDIQKVTIDDLNSFIFEPDAATFKKLKMSIRSEDVLERLFRNLYLSKYSYMSNRSHFGDRKNGAYVKLKKNLKKFQDRLSGVVIENLDYKNIIQQYDSNDTFFYLDPPYVNTDDYNHTVDHTELFELLSQIKGRFLMSLDNGDLVRGLCKKHNFNHDTIETTYNNAKGKINKTELVIQNF